MQENLRLHVIDEPAVLVCLDYYFFFGGVKTAYNLTKKKMIIFQKKIITSMPLNYTQGRSEQSDK